jgi:MFS family permease
VDEPPGPHERRAGRFRLSGASPEVTSPLSAAVALRAVAGLLTLFLAFLLRREDASGLLVAGVLAAAALGQLSGTGLAARLPESRATLLSWVALGLPFAACLLAAVWPTGGWVVAAAGATGVSVSLSKFALDAAVQAHVAPRSLSTAFARSETALQLAWVLGGGLALAIPTVATYGFAAAAVLPVLGLLLARWLAQRAVVEQPDPPPPAARPSGRPPLRRSLPPRPR